MHDFIIHGIQKDIVEKSFHELLHVRTGLAINMSGLARRSGIGLAFEEGEPTMSTPFRVSGLSVTDIEMFRFGRR
jgi:hypothetical protein